MIKTRLVYENNIISLKLFAIKQNVEHEVLNKNGAFLDYIIIGNAWHYLDGNFNAIAEILEKLKIDLSDGVSYTEYMSLTREFHACGIEYEDEIITVIENIKENNQTFNVEGLRANLFPYQERGCNWLAFMQDNQCGCILGDEMGLGKTLQIEKLISTGKRFYHDRNTNTGVLCLRSKNYHHSKKGPDFWFGYHPEQKEQLATYNKSYIAFYLPEDGGLIVLPTSYVDAKLEFLNPTYKDGKLIHWHIHIDKFDGVYLFRIPNKGRENINKHVIRDIKTSSDEQVAAVDNDNVIKITSSKFKSIKK